MEERNGNLCSSAVFHNLMGDVRNDDVIEESEPVTSIKRSEATRTSYDRLCSSLLHGFHVFDISFYELCDALGVSREYIRV